MAETIRMEGDKMLVVGDRRWPVSEFNHEDVELPESIRGRPWITHYRRAAVAFESGWLLSILWGNATYSDNYGGLFDDVFRYTDEPERVEVGVCHRQVGLIGDPWPYVDADNLNALLETVAGWRSDPAYGIDFLRALATADDFLS